MTVRTAGLMAAAAVLAVAGGSAITVAATHDPPQPPLAAGTPSAAPDSAAPSGGGPDDVLTKGPLMSTSAPTRVAIPALKVDVPVIGLGQLPDGTMQVPADATTVGWYTKAPTPGALGPAVLAGHVDYHGKAGTFARLAVLEKGDAVTVTRTDGGRAVFAVTEVERYAKNRFPSEAVYGPIDHAGLRLITCGGDFDSSAGHYRDNIVVYAALRETH
jgi:sortase (surface protein transpeptidase)